MPTQLTEWFGAKVREWRLLQIYRIHHALPFQTSPLPDPGTPYRRLGQGLFVCGEYCAPASLLWAMVAGRRTAEAILAIMQGGK